MAFIPESFKSGRGIFYARTSDGALAIHTYISSDTFAQITANGYFPAHFGVPSEEVADYDYVWIVSSTSSQLCKFSNTATNPTFLASLSIPQLNGTFNATFNAISWSHTISITYSLQGGSAYLMIPAVSVSAASNNIATMTAALPALLTPVIPFKQSARVLNAGGTEEGYITVGTGNPGIIIAPFSPTGSPGTYGWSGMSIYYQLLTTVG